MQWSQEVLSKISYTVIWNLKNDIVTPKINFLEKLVTTLRANVFWNNFCLMDINTDYGAFINGFNSKTGISSTKFISPYYTFE